MSYIFLMRCQVKTLKQGEKKTIKKIPQQII